MMTMRIEPGEGVPLWVDDEHRTIRVTGTRLKLEAIIRMYEEGLTRPEEIVEAFDVLTIDAAERIGDWRRGHPVEVKAYMRQVEREEASVLAQLAPRVEEARKRRKGLWTRRTLSRPA